MPRDAESTAPSSDRMSPKVFSMTMTSKRVGWVMRSIAQESTSWCSSSTSGYSLPSSVATSRHMRLDSRTLALSTEVSLRLRERASSNPTRMMRSTSFSV